MAISVQMDIVKIQRDPSGVFVPRVSNSLHQRISVKILTNAISGQSVRMDAAGTQKDLSDASVAKATHYHLLEISVKMLMNAFKTAIFA